MKKIVIRIFLNLSLGLSVFINLLLKRNLIHALYLNIYELCKARKKRGNNIIKFVKVLLTR